MAPSFPNFRNESNSDYPKSSLTLISEYQKLGGHRTRSGISDDHVWNSGFASSTLRNDELLVLQERRARMQSTLAPSIARRCAKILPRACPIRRSPRRSTRNSTPPIPATPRSAAPSDWGLPVPPADRPGIWPKRPPRAKPSTAAQDAARRVHVRMGRCRSSNGRRPPKLRCVETDPRHLSLLELEPGDCRYPYGGDEEGEAITFCGQPCSESSSYCAPHFHLTRGPGRPLKRPAGTVSLRLVEAA